MLPWYEVLAIVLAGLYVFDRVWKVLAVWRSFRQKPSPEPVTWPSVSLIQPVTVSPNDLRSALIIRAQMQYTGKLEQIIVCDEQDNTSQMLCRELMEQFPEWKPELVVAQSPDGLALKTVKQLVGLESATGDVLCFIDDDILLRKDTLAVFVRSLLQPEVGAVFGLACYTNWHSLWGGLMSAFVNANALMNYIPLAYLTEPYTITGHMYAIRRDDFHAIGGLTGMEARLDDDHELARRVRRAGLINQQTRALYDVDNELPSLRSFLNQMKRWFVFPRELMLPNLPLSKKIPTFLVSLPNLLPGLVLLLALGGGGFPSWLAFIACLAVFCGVYFWSERYILKEPMPAWGWFLLLMSAVFLPFQILFVMFSDNVILWRGRRYRVARNGGYELVA